MEAAARFSIRDFFSWYVETARLCQLNILDVEHFIYPANPVPNIDYFQLFSEIPALARDRFEKELILANGVNGNGYQNYTTNLINAEEYNNNNNNSAATTSKPIATSTVAMVSS